jgi:hypothetical protein
MLKGSNSSLAAVETEAKTYGQSEVMLMLCRALFSKTLTDSKISMNVLEWVSDDAEAATLEQTAVAALQADFDKGAKKAAAKAKAAKKAEAEAKIAEEIAVKGAEARKAKVLEDRKNGVNSQIFVKTLTGKTVTFDCNLTKDATTTVEAMKYAICDTEGIPIDQQRLIFGGQSMENARTLLDYRVTKEDMLHCEIAAND